MSNLRLFTPIVLFVAGCAPDPRDLHVVQEAKSPDGKLTAAYVEDTGGGAAVGTGLDVYVFEGSGPRKYSDRVFSEECVRDVRVSWLGPRQLQITYGAPIGQMPSRSPGPWWTFGHIPHDLTLKLSPHPTDRIC